MSNFLNYYSIIKIEINNKLTNDKENSKITEDVDVFLTSWISKHSIDLIKKALKEKGINVEEEYFYAKNRPTDEELKEAETFAKKWLERHE